MTAFVRINRRLFLARLGKGAIALAVLGACGSRNAECRARCCCVAPSKSSLTTTGRWSTP